MKLKKLIPEPIRRWLFWRRVKLLSIFKRSAHAIGWGKFTWKMSLPSEVGFWDDYLRSRGRSCNAEAEFAFRTSSDSELQPWLREWLESPDAGTVRVLDVGAGPLTWVGKKWGNRRISVAAVDPLADAYNELMANYGIVPPLRTERGNGEEIVERFGREAFDLVFARNSLDHSFDAIAAVTAMVEVTKPGGILFLWHKPDEAEAQDYQGLHQWNFRLDENELIVWRGNRAMNVNATFAGCLTTLRCELRDGMIQGIYRRGACGTFR